MNGHDVINVGSVKNVKAIIIFNITCRPGSLVCLASALVDRKPKGYP